MLAAIFGAAAHRNLNPIPRRVIFRRDHFGLEYHFTYTAKLAFFSGIGAGRLLIGYPYTSGMSISRNNPAIFLSTGTNADFLAIICTIG